MSEVLVVFGSINLDIAFRSGRLPAPGETVLGHDYIASPGGKGANQAHAAQCYGMPTALYGAVGTDMFALVALANLDQAGVDLSHIQHLDGQTGCAGIAVDDAGRNQIVVAPGVNLALRQNIVSDDALQNAKAVLLQMEVNLAENWTLIERAHRLGCRTVLNNAPAQDIPKPVLRSLDVLIVNEIELVQTAQAAGISAGSADTLAQVLAREFAVTVALTLGERGAICVRGSDVLTCPAPRVQAVDTTGAGDTFAGVFTAALIEGSDLLQAMRIATTAASLACTRVGAQIAQPKRAEIEAALAAG